MKKRSEASPTNPRCRKTEKQPGNQPGEIESVPSRQASETTIDALLLEDHEWATVLEGYDPGGLARAKTSWFFGDWKALADLDMTDLSSHPDRDRFALLAASGHQQLANHDLARKFTRLALQWGCPPKAVAQVLVAGVHNTLGRASALKGDQKRIHKHFHEAVAISPDKKETALAASARSSREMHHLGLLDQFFEQAEGEIESIELVHARPTELRERVAQLEDLFARIRSEKDAKGRAVDRSENERSADKVSFLHKDCVWLEKAVADFLTAKGPSAPFCVDQERLGLLGALLSLVGGKRGQQEKGGPLDGAIEFIREADGLLLAEAGSSALIGKLYKADYDPVLITEWLFCRSAELLGLSLMTVGDYKSAMRIYSELLRLNKLDEISGGMSGINAGWLIENYDKRSTFNVLEGIIDLSSLIAFFTSDAEVEERTKYFWCKVLADFHRRGKDNLKASHYYSLALKFSHGDVWLAKQCVEALVEMNQATHAVGVWLDNVFEQFGISSSEKATLLELFEKASSKMKPVEEHGHLALMKAVDDHISMIRQRAGDKKLVMIEIGTTRELVGGQGSTEKLARFCHDRKLHFITVDMDPINTESAREFVQKIDPEFELVAAKGEDYLAGYKEQIDFVFLDAYDFDHGNHSSARQTRYERVLGERINDAACHQMHLDCAISLASKLSRWGIIAFDDVWFKDGSWRGKGTTAMPYLLANGFQVTHLANNVAILVRYNADI